MSTRAFLTLLALSGALHVAAFGLLPHAAAVEPRRVLAPVAVEPARSSVPPPVPVPQPVSPMSRDAGTPMRATLAPTRTRVTKQVRAVMSAAPLRSAAPVEETADLTGMVLSNAEGTATLAELAGARDTTTTQRPSQARTAALVEAPVAADHTSPPRPPSLDAALATNYPAAARAAGINGRARVRVRVGADGRVVALRVVSESAPGFGHACAASLRTSRWEPALARNGRAITTDVIFTCAFEVHR
jgi:periplasmic protein TonB